MNAKIANFVLAVLVEIKKTNKVYIPNNEGNWKYMGIKSWQ